MPTAIYAVPAHPRPKGLSNYGLSNVLLPRLLPLPPPGQTPLNKNSSLGGPSPYHPLHPSTQHCGSPVEDSVQAQHRLWGSPKKGLLPGKNRARKGAGGRKKLEEGSPLPPLAVFAS